LIRSFLAIEIPVTVLKKIEMVQEDLKSSRADVRWVNPGKMHLTLKFFGNIEESQVEPIVDSIGGPVRAVSPFPLQAKGLGAFPQIRNPRVIWLGLVDSRKILIPFQKELEDQFEKIGFQRENRPFQPHLTLGRTTSSRGRDELVGRIEKYREEEFGEVQVEGITLFKSELRPSGPIYTVLRKLEFGSLPGR